MLIALIGENCTGKSLLANKLAEKVECAVFTGRDYLRLAKNEFEARKKFEELLQHCADGVQDLIYIISEPEHLAFLPVQAVKVSVAADIDIIKMRFAKRLGG